MAVMDNLAERARFSLLTYKHMCAKGAFTDNLLFSPLSMEMALLMAYMGAEGKTQREIAGLLGLNAQHTVEDLSGNCKQIKEGETQKQEPVKVITSTGYYMYDFEPVDCYKLYMASAAFVDGDFPLDISYVTTLQTLFNAHCLPVNFIDDDQSAAQIINDFVKDHTNGLVRDLLSPDDFTVLTRIVIINALYFKSNWHRQFYEKDTAQKPFTTGNGSEIMVDTMHITARFNYCKSKDLGGAKLLQMPYVENVCSAFFLLPEKDEFSQKRSPEQGISDLCRVLTATSLFDAIQNMCSVEHVKVQIPKFRVKENLDLGRLLTDMGMPTAFDPTLAEFSGICQEKSRRLHISKVKQQAFIDVNEKGTEAGAATAAIMEEKCLGPDTKADFIADRPFVFFIRHDKTNSILFMGHIADPTNAQDSSIV